MYITIVCNSTNNYFIGLLLCTCLVSIIFAIKLNFRRCTLISNISNGLFVFLLEEICPWKVFLITMPDTYQYVIIHYTLCVIMSITHFIQRLLVGLPAGSLYMIIQPQFLPPKLIDLHLKCDIRLPQHTGTSATTTGYFIQWYLFYYNVSV